MVLKRHPHLQLSEVTAGLWISAKVSPVPPLTVLMRVGLVGAILCG